MSKGISPKLPLSTNEEDGKYALNKTLKEVVAQNLKNLILTIPGERIMDPDFGVGLKTFLFRENAGLLYGEIRAKLNTQVARYMPFVEIEDVEFISSEEDPFNVSANVLFINITYHVIPLGINDNLELNV
jgi:phage baseplate assembly protein W